jgi:glucose/mannose-6-phosphate isomerase
MTSEEEIVLDDLKYIHERDAQDALGTNEKQWQQLTEHFDVTLPADRTYENVVLAGMGGSALAALFVTSWPGLQVPFQTVRDYDIPAYVSDRTLFIASSYSGNTEETLSALDQAEKTGAQVVIIASGGKLIEIAQNKHYPYLQLPAISQPRYAALASVKALVSLLVAAELAEASVLTELEAASEWLKEAIQAWLPTVPTAQNQAKQLALEIIGKSVVMYSGPKFYPAAYKWKISFNENAKHIAWVNQYPEFNHNEFIGWTKQPVDKPYTVIDLRSNLEHPRVLKRFEVSERLLSGLRPSPQVVTPEGESLLQQLLWTIALGDFTSLYVALLNGINPTPVDLIETFKKSLDI